MATTPVPAKRGRKPAAATAQQAGGQVQSLTRGLKLLEWIAESHSSVALTELAQQAGLSEFHFARMFRQSLNMAPHQYVMQQRMAKAQNLICHSALPLTEIALACGFSSPSHFSHRVKAATGLTPSQLRAAQRG